MINGFPPKIIWLRGGNKTTPEIANLMLMYSLVIEDFIQNQDQACLEIE
jgi:predicted nuclease of predicted toxin-antitoxin system